MADSHDSIAHDFVESLLDEELSFKNYETFLESWRDYVVTRNDTSTTNTHLEQLDRSSQRALSKLVEPTTQGSQDFRVSKIFYALNNSAIVCDSKGKLLLANQKAGQNIGLSAGMLLDDTDITLLEPDFEGEKLSALFGRPAKSHDLNLCRYRRSKQDHGIVAIMMLDNQQPTRWLLVFMDTPWNRDAQELLATKFDLTNAEVEIIKAFAVGTPLKQIASERKRSYVTVRNQFHSILAKTGCPSQASLLRLLFGTNYLFSSISLLSNHEQETVGKPIELMRPGGRFLDVQLFGDFEGTPIIWLPSVFGFPVTPTIVQSLKKRKLLMIGVACPGLGKTSPMRDQDDLHECMASDIVAILDSMSIDSCVFTGRASASRSLVKLSKLIPERMSEIFSVNSLVPFPYVKQNSIASHYTRALLTASKLSPTITTLILGTGAKLMYRNGVAAFFNKLYKHSPRDQSVTTESEVIKSIEDGVEFITRQGLSAGVKYMIDGFDDWRSEAEEAGKKITLIHGDMDPQVPIEACRKFVADYPDTLELDVIEGGGGLLNYTHFDAIFDRLTQSRR